MKNQGIILAGLCLVLFFMAGRAWSETVYWSDDFESGATNRWQSTGDWKISSPSAGPGLNAAGYRTHSGVICASTQGYTPNRDVRLICTNYNGTNSLLVPGASLNPRLRFWHWFNFANALGFVEISTNKGGSWYQISPTYQDIASGGVWSRPWVDLSGYAGQRVQFAFRFYGGSSANGLGWYIDDVAVITSKNPPALALPESFEFDPKTSDWSVDGGTWEIGQPTSGPGAAHTGTNCAATVLAGSYAANVNSRLISPSFVVPASGAVLEFWHWYQFNNAVGIVEVSTDGNTWTQVSPTYGSGNTLTWLPEVLDLTAYAGKTIHLALHFGSGNTTTASGWYVDDLSLAIVSVLNVPTNQVISYGHSFTNSLSATNSQLPNAVFTFAVANDSATNVVVQPAGLITWTNTMAPPGVYTVYAKVTDNNSPPLSATNSFTVTVLPLPSQFTLSSPATLASGSSFKFGVTSLWTNLTWRIVATTNLKATLSTWSSIYTNVPGVGGTLMFTDLLATNSLQRYYRVVSP